MASQRPLVVGVDGSSDSRAALQWARRLAQAEGRPLVLVYVLSGTGPRNAERVALHAIARGVDPDELALEEGTRLVEAVRRDAGPATGPESIRVDVGDPGPTIVAVAKDEDAEAIVVGARGRGRLSRAILGSVAEQVAAKADRSVVTIHAPGHP